TARASYWQTAPAPDTALLAGARRRRAADSAGTGIRRGRNCAAPSPPATGTPPPRRRARRGRRTRRGRAAPARPHDCARRAPPADPARRCRPAASLRRRAGCDRDRGGLALTRDQGPLALNPPAIAGDVAVAADHPMARHDDRQLV